MYSESENIGNKLSLHFLPPNIDIQNDRQTWPLWPFDLEQVKNVKMCLYIFILQDNTDILTNRSTKSDDLDFSLIFNQQGWYDFKDDKIEGQHKVRPIFSINTSNWSACQDQKPHKFYFHDLIFFKVNSKVKGQQGPEIDSFLILLSPKIKKILLLKF